jgi:hypothetical protein
MVLRCCGAAVLRLRLEDKGDRLRLRLRLRLRQNQRQKQRQRVDGSGEYFVTPLLREIALMDNGVPPKFRRLLREDRDRRIPFNLSLGSYLI